MKPEFDHVECVWREDERGFRVVRLYTVQMSPFCTGFTGTLEECRRYLKVWAALKESRDAKRVSHHKKRKKDERWMRSRRRGGSHQIHSHD